MDNFDQTIFSKRFNHLLESSGKSASEVSRELNVSKQIISSWRNGYRTPKQPTIFAIAHHFGVGPDWLSGKTNKMQDYSLDYFAEDHSIDPFDALLILRFNAADNGVQKSICKLLDITDDEMRRGGILRE